MPIEINFTIEKGFNEHNIKLPTDKNSRSLLYVTVIDVWNYQYLICQDRGFGVQKVKRVYELSHQCGKRENSRGEGDVTVGNGQQMMLTSVMMMIFIDVVVVVIVVVVVVNAFSQQ